MSQRLPIGDYRWMPESELNRKFNTPDEQKNADSILNLKDDSDDGYIFEVDLHYPPELHDKHNDYPFCPERRSVDNIMKNEKLLLTFYDKKNYITHFSMLKLALKHGLILKKVHRVLQFKQVAWLKSYIDMNTKHRTQANNDFEKDYYKYMNNAIYGKCLENIRQRTDIRLVNRWIGGEKNARNLIAQPNFKKCVIFDENLVSIEMQKTHVMMNKPIIVGMCVLELSKVVMYSFLYDYIKRKYGQDAALVYTDTDSFLLEFKVNDVYADIRDDPDMFDTWDYPENSIYGIKRHNKKVPGKFSDELKGEIIIEVVGLRAKCYAVRIKLNKLKGVKQNVIKKAKGVKKNVLKKTVSFDDYYNCVKNNCIELRKQYTIRSLQHEVYTISTQKIALNPFDDKRCINKGRTMHDEQDSFDTLAWGHYKLTPEKMNEEYKYAKDIAECMKQALEK